VRKNLVFAAAVLVGGFIWGQRNLLAQSSPSALSQSVCEENILREFAAKEVTEGPEYQTFREVALAFGRNKMPKLYFFSEGAPSYYIAGSASSDGRGKILVSRIDVGLMGNTPALKGMMAHEMAHLETDAKDPTGCDQDVFGGPEIEEAADALAARRVGFAPIKAFLVKMRELAEEKEGAICDTTMRLKALEKLEMR